MTDDESQWFLLFSSINTIDKTLKIEIVLFNKIDWKACTRNDTVYILIWCYQFLPIG